MSKADEINNLAEQHIDKVYDLSPERIVSDYNGEVRLMENYRGRQIFELLQNADDCGDFANSGGHGIKLKFEIGRDGDRSVLAVSNTGEPFSVDGVKSLLIRDLSSKKRGDTIGYMGLGFRSVLNWTSDIKIVTNDFTVSFSEASAKAKYEKFKATANEEIRLKLDEIDRTAVLASCSARETDETEARRWLADGYVTAILLYCDEPCLDKIRTELQGLQFEELLFMKHIEEIKIATPDGERTIESVREDVSGKGCTHVVVEEFGESADARTLSEWYVWKREGVANTSGDRQKADKFEIALAYNTDEKKRREIRDKTGHLYSYFKTEIRMPFSFLVHGNFSLNDNRTSIISGDEQNRFILDSIADFMCETSQKISKVVCGEDRCNYTALSVLIPEGVPDEGVLAEYGFFSNLESKVRELKILPSISDEYLSLADEPRYSGDFVENEEEDGKKRRVYFAGVLDKKTFRLLLKHCDDSIVTRYLRHAGVPNYDISELSSLVDENAREYVDDKRYIDIIRLIYKAYGNRVTTVPHLILDSDGELVTDGSKIYVNFDSAFDLPSWAHMRFMDPVMQTDLKPYFEEAYQSLAKNLSAFGCRDYSLSEIVQDLKDLSDGDAERTEEFLCWLYRHWKGNGCSLSSELLSNIYVVSNAGDIVRADECYLGDEYGFSREKRITQYIADIRYLAPKEEIGLTTDASEDADVVRFLHSIGLNEFPRFETIELSYDEAVKFLRYIFTNFGEEYSTLRDNFYQYDGYRDIMYWKYFNVYVLGVRNLDDILGNADFYDIVYWLMSVYKSNELRKYIESEFERSAESEITGMHAGGHSPRRISHEKIHSWLRYKLSTTSWMRIGGASYGFSKCTTSPNDFYPYVYSLSRLSKKDIKAKIGNWAFEDILDLFGCLGMAERIVDLPVETIYGLLYELPNLKKADVYKDRRDVTELYDSINEAFDSMPSDFNLQEFVSCGASERFFESGEILARVGDEYEYLPTGDVYYVDTLSPLSGGLLKNCPMISLPPKSGDDKIGDLFGVRSIDDVEVEFTSQKIHSASEDNMAEFTRLMPYIYATRMKDGEESEDLDLLRKMEILLLESTEIEIKYGDKTELSCLDDYAFYVDRPNRRAYVKIPSGVKKTIELKKRPGYTVAMAKVMSIFFGDSQDVDAYTLIFGSSVRDNEARFKAQGLEYYLDMAKEKMGVVNPRADFWESIASVLDGDAEEIARTYESVLPSDFNFEDLNSNDMAVIKSLFHELKISVSDFNGHSRDHIHFASYNDSLFDKLKDEYRDRYLYWVASRLRDSEKTISDYRAKQLEYDRYKTDCDDMDFDPEAEFEKAFKVSVNGLTPVGDDFKEILGELARRGDKSKEREKFGEDGAEGISDISDRVAKTPNEPDYKAVMDKVDSKKTATFYDGIEWAPIVRARSGISLGGRRRGRTYDSETDVTRKENGFEAEYVVFKMLEEMEGIGQIKDLDWVSGNAEYAGVKPKLLASDVAGYDISFVDSDGTKHYVDVKGTSSTGAIRFSLSKNEFKMGMKTIRMPGVAYDIYFVPLGNDYAGYRVRRFEKFFVFGDSSESFFNNKRYSVDYKSFDVTMTGGASASGSEDYIVEIGRDDEDGQI